MDFYIKNHTSLTRNQFSYQSSLLWLLLILIIFQACNNNDTPPPAQEIVTTPEQMKEKVPEVIRKFIRQAVLYTGKIDDSTTVRQSETLNFLYDKTDHVPFWSNNEQWIPAKDSLLQFIDNSRLYGLFPEDYHSESIHAIIERFSTDSASRKDAVLWSKADLMLTDAFLQVMHDVKLGRLQKDSITLRSDSAIENQFYEDRLGILLKESKVKPLIDSLEPNVRGYQKLKAAIPAFLDSAEFIDFTYVPFPVYDTVKFRQALQLRLKEENLLDTITGVYDSVKVAKAIKKYQQKKKLAVDGKAGGATVRSLNLTDKNKFVRIAINMDKFKHLPIKMPDKYVWVNLPGFYLELWDKDTIRLVSKVVVGKPLTRTPELNSSISDMITYPQWTIPNSIIEKEILPALKKNPGYLEEKGYSLIDENNEEVDPYFVDWSKYKKRIPYKVVQGSGDDNALGIMKFNFPNKYSVYLHDTNQRYLFTQVVRALSHGCVRVQEWSKLTNYILRNDSLAALKTNGNFTKSDSVEQWLTRKEKHYIPVRNKIPLFIRYFTCEGRDGKIIFYDDIYNEDRHIQERYFAGK